MSNLAIIPARGGSKRIPRKNIKDFLGRPILSYSIKTALQSRLFDEVMVSTDDYEIAEVAKKFGAQVPFIRSEENSTDFAATVNVIIEVLAKYKAVLNKEFKFVCCIYPAAPLIEPQDLITGYNLLCEGKFHSLFPVVPFSYPIWRGLEREDGGLTNMLWPENLNTRTQDLKKVYHDAGQWYWLNALMVDKGVFSSNAGTIIMSELDVQDIDNVEDWKMAELKYKMKHEI